MISNLQLSNLQIWQMAIRPKTLPAAAAPVIVASALAYSHGVFRPWLALACLVTALLLQIAANLANDMFDFQRGADTHLRLGPVRVTQAGLLTRAQVKRGMWACFGLAAVLGVYVSANSSWLILLPGALAILAALAYSGGPLPFGYYGLGEIGVFLFFGVAAVCGTYFAQAERIDCTAGLLSISMGCLSTSILIVNNLRDIQTDRTGGKKTLAAQFGESFARHEYTAMLVIAFSIPLLLWAFGMASVWALLAFGSLPLAFQVRQKVNRLEGKALNQVLAETGQLELVFGVLVSTGLVIGYLFLS